MSNSKNYVPYADLKFILWVKRVLAYALANFEKWGVIDPTDMLAAPLADFEVKLAKATEPDSGQVAKRSKNEARQLLERAVRAYLQGFVMRNPKVTNDDRGEMELPVYDRTPTAVAEPTGMAKLSFSLTLPTQLMVHIEPIEADSQDRRVNYGSRIYWGFPDAGDPTPQGRNLRESRFTRRKKELFTFAPEDSGRTVYFCVRYENSKGQAGPWGPVASATIP